MANGHVEIHDPLANRKDPNGAADPNPGVEDVQDSVEFRMMRAYAQRRRRQRGGDNNNENGPKMETQTGVVGSGEASPATTPATTPTTTPATTPATTPSGTKRGRKKGWRKIFKCIKPQTDDAEEPQDAYNRCLPAAGEPVPCVLNGTEPVGGELEAVAADRLMRIADEIPFAPPDVESDAPGDDEKLETLISLLLREAGDRLNEKQELRDALAATQLFSNYGFFERLIQALLRRMGLSTPDSDALGPQTSPKTQMAVTCEVTTRLSAADTIPMNRLLGYGATYLQKHISPWAKQHGGYDAVFEEDDDDEDVQ